MSLQSRHHIHLIFVLVVVRTINHKRGLSRPFPSTARTLSWGIPFLTGLWGIKLIQSIGDPSSPTNLLHRLLCSLLLFLLELDQIQVTTHILIVGVACFFMVKKSINWLVIRLLGLLAWWIVKFDSFFWTASSYFWGLIWFITNQDIVKDILLLCKGIIQKIHIKFQSCGCLLVLFNKI